MGHRPDIILNVDDDPANRYAVTRILQREGFEVREAATGAEALRLAREHPDLVILDVRLPDIDGREVARRLREDPHTAQLAILQLSAHAVRSEERAEGLERGADVYLTQPIASRELVAAVRSLLRIRQAEERARLAAGQWSATFDAIQDGIGVFERDGRLARCNEAFASVLGRPGVELVGLPWDALMRPLLGSSALPDLDGILTQGERYQLDQIIGDRFFQLGVDPILTSVRPEGAVVVLIDVTERRRLEEEAQRRAEALAEADRRKDEFLAMLGHELRNPLAALTAAMEIAEPGAELDSRVHDIMKRQLHHVARLVDDLLEVSRITRGKIELRKERIDLRSPLHGALQAAATVFEGRRHTVEVTLPEEPVPIEGDATRLQQVIANLLDNAAKYTEPGGRIAVSLGTEDGSAVLRVRDTGVGIAPERLAHIFELFVQLDPTLDRTRGGLGIGLTLVKQLVEMHGGQVEASSVAGQGTEFVVRLPSSQSRRRLDPAAAADPEQKERPLRVLVVEDNDDMREMLVFALRRRGHEVLEAQDGPGGLEAVLQQAPDVALVDVGLPGIDGYELARRVRAQEAGRKAYLVALTGYGRASDRSESRAAGFDLHLVKPVGIKDIEDILSKVRTSESR